MASSRLRPLLVGLAAASILGCQQDEIRTYQVAKTEMTRLLGAILPHGDSTWFFKLSGPSKAVAEQEKAFDAFLHSLQFDGAEKLRWTLPGGWRESKEPFDARYATILAGPEDSPLELTVTKLGRAGQAADVAANVDRWRKQLALPPVKEEELARVTRKLEVNGHAITVVDLTGTGSGKTSTMPAFAGEGRMPAAKAKQAKSDVGYRAPDGWKRAPNTSFSKLAFEVQEGGERATVTVTPLPESSVEINVKRWREEQLGLAPISDAEARQLVQEIDVDGIPGQYVDLRNARQRLLAVRAPRGTRCWFVKIIGSIDLVGKQKANFEAFVRSLRFDGGPGDNDG